MFWAATTGIGSRRTHFIPCKDLLKKTRKQPPAQHVDGETCRKRERARPAASAVAGCGLAAYGRMRGVCMGNALPLSRPWLKKAVPCREVTGYTSCFGSFVSAYRENAVLSSPTCSPTDPPWLVQHPCHCGNHPCTGVFKHERGEAAFAFTHGPNCSE